MEFRAESKEFVQLVVENLTYRGPKDLTQYFIRDTRMEMSGDMAVVQVSKDHHYPKCFECFLYSQVYLGRRLLGTILTIYIPSFLMILISYLTNYFKPFFFEATVAVNLTVMLVS